MHDITRKLYNLETLSCTDTLSEPHILNESAIVETQITQKHSIVYSFQLTFRGQFPEWLTSVLQYAYLMRLLYHTGAAPRPFAYRSHSFVNAAAMKVAGFSSFYMCRVFTMMNYQIVHFLLLRKQKVS